MYASPSYLVITGPLIGADPRAGRLFSADPRAGRLSAGCHVSASRIVSAGLRISAGRIVSAADALGNNRRIHGLFGGTGSDGAI